jgi:hypothetical protein
MKTAFSFPTLVTATILVFLFAACVVAAARADDNPPNVDTLAPAESEKDLAAELEKAKQKFAPTYTLAYKFAPGDQVRTKVVHLVTVETKIKGTTQTAKTRSVSTKLWRIKEIDAQGQITFEHVVEHVDMWNSVSGRQEVRFDSSSGEKPPPGYEQVAGSVGKVLATVTMDQHGRVIARTGAQPQFNPGIGELTIPFPNQPVKIGTTWSIPDEIKMKLDDGTFKKVQTKQQYKLEKVELGVAHIAVDTHVLTPVNDPKVQAELVQRLQHGTIKFDLDSGRLRHKQMDMDEEVYGFSGGDSHMQYLARLTEEPLAAAEQTAREEASTSQTK